MLLFLLFLVFVTPEHCGGAKWIPTYAGRWKVIIRQVDVCPGADKDPIVAYYRVSHPKPGEIQTMTGNLTNTVSFNDTYGVFVNMDLWNNNQWKSNAFLFPFPKNACSMVRKHLPNFFTDILHQDKDTSKTCVVAPGIYTVTDTPFDAQSPSIPMIPYGRYRFTLTSKNNAGMRAICTMFDIDIVPRV